MITLAAKARKGKKRNTLSKRLSKMGSGKRRVVRRGRGGKKPMSAQARRKYNRNRYVKNRKAILKAQHRRYHSDAGYRRKKLRAAARYRRKKNRPLYLKGGRGAKKPHRKSHMPRIHKPNKFVGGKKRRRR